MEQENFIARLVQLRVNKGVSAREMSLSLGQGENYINSIENGNSFPSMTVFFYICEYFNITPQEFFDMDSKNPTKSKELEKAARGLSTEQLDHLIAITKNLKR